MITKHVQLLPLFIICLTGAIIAQPSITFNTKTDFTTGTSPYSAAIVDIRRRSTRFGCG